MVSAIAVLPSRLMVITASALASSSWATMVLRRLGLTVLTGFSGLAALGALRLAMVFGFAALLRATAFFAGAFRGLILLYQAGLHLDCGVDSLRGDNEPKLGPSRSLFKWKGGFLSLS